MRTLSSTGLSVLTFSMKSLSLCKFAPELCRITKKDVKSAELLNPRSIDQDMHKRLKETPVPGQALQDLIEANHGRGRQNGRRRSRWFELRNGRPLFLHLLCGDVFRRAGLFVRLRGNPQGLLGFGEVLLCHLFGLGRLLVTCNGLVEGLSLGFPGSKFRSCGGKVFLQRVSQGSVPIPGELQDVTLQACDLLAELLQTELLEWTVLMMSWAGVGHTHVHLHPDRDFLDRGLASTAFLGRAVVLRDHCTRGSQRRPLTWDNGERRGHTRRAEPTSDPGTEAATKALGTHMFHFDVLWVESRCLGQLPLLLETGFRGQGRALGVLRRDWR